MPINIPVDFTGVESRARIRVPEGDYIAKVVKVEQKPSAQKKTPGLYVTFEGVAGALQGKRIMDRHWLTKDSLWTLRNMLEAMGYQVPAGPMQLKENMLKGKKVGLTIIDGEEYKGRISSEIADYIPVSVVGNVTSGSDVTEDEEEDDLAAFGVDDEDEEETQEEIDGRDGIPTEAEEDDEEEEDEDEDSFAFDEDDDEEEDDEEEVELSFTPKQVQDAKGKDLLPMVKEAQDAGWDLGLPDKPKVAQVKEALLALFEDEEDDDEMETFSLDDVE